MNLINPYEKNSSENAAYNKEYSNKLKESAQNSANAITTPGKLGDKILKFPLDIDDDPYKRNKSVTLYILNQQSWKDFEKTFTAGNLNKAYDAFLEGLKAAGDSFSDVASKFKEEGFSLETVKTGATKTYDAGIKFAEGFQKGAYTLVEGTQTSLNDLKPENLGHEAIDTIIRLPIPNNLMDIDNHSYTGSKFEDSSLISTIQKPYKEFSELVNAGAQSVGSIKRKAGEALMTPVPQMPVLNPFTWQRFDGSELKTFGFVFFMVPRSQEEAIQMMKIVYKIKKASYPTQMNLTSFDKTSSIDSGLMVPPCKVLLKFENPVLQKLINPGVCVIKTITTTYNEGNTVGITGDGIPRFIELNINIEEYNQKFQENF